MEASETVLIARAAAAVLPSHPTEVLAQYTGSGGSGYCVEHLNTTQFRFHTLSAGGSDSPHVPALGRAFRFKHKDRLVLQAD